MFYPWFKPFMDKKSNIKNLKKIVQNNSLTMGKYCYQLEEEIKRLLKVKYVILTTSGTSALMIASIVAGIGKGKKVYASDMSWVAAVNPAKLLGADLHLFDTVNKSDLINYKLLNEKIKKNKPKAVILSHMNGEPMYDKNFMLLKKMKKFTVIEDCAQAFMVKHGKKFCGTIFDIGCFSLSITKLITMVYGGFCVTNSKILAERMKAIRNNGLSATPENAWLQVSSEIGLNLKASNLHAHIGLDNIKFLNSSISQVNRIHNYYLKNINNPKLKIIDKNTKNSIPIYVYVHVDNRNKLIKFCQKHKIGLHLGFRGLHENKPFFASQKKYKNSNFYSKNFVRFPSGPGYNIKDIKKICKILNKF